MVQIAGKYAFVSQDKFEDYLKAAGKCFYQINYKFNNYFAKFNYLNDFIGQFDSTFDHFWCRQDLFKEIAGLIYSIYNEITKIYCR
jgi:hypothetical protein